MPCTWCIYFQCALARQGKQGDSMGTCAFRCEEEQYLCVKPGGTHTLLASSWLIRNVISKHASMFGLCQNASAFSGTNSLLAATLKFYP